jgi:hypothetical protein
VTLTKKQKSAAATAILFSGAACLLSVLGWVIVTVLQQPAQAQPHVTTVNAQRYERISLGNDDGTVDHFCLGTTGVWYGPNSSDFTVQAGDPLCR